MNEEQRLEGIKLINEFLGMTRNDYQSYATWTDGSRERFENSFNYHTSWDAIMPVVDKIEALDPLYYFHIKCDGFYRDDENETDWTRKQYVTTLQRGFEVVINSAGYGDDRSSRLQSIYVAVVSFLKFKYHS